MTKEAIRMSKVEELHEMRRAEILTCVNEGINTVAAIENKLRDYSNSVIQRVCRDMVQSGDLVKMVAAGNRSHYYPKGYKP